MDIQNNLKYQQEINQSRNSKSLKNLKKLYKLANFTLMSLASNVNNSKTEQKIETQMLEDKDMLSLSAAEIKCQNLQEISQKVDFIYMSFLEEKTVSEFSPTDILIKSLWEDCQTHI